MEIGIVGKTNVGKSSFFKAATMIDVEISDGTFVTIKPNVGVGYVTAPCPHRELNVKCSPKNSLCINETRLIPVKLLDVAGLVPGAHEGRGLGNQFLNDLVPADILIHVVDISGTTDSEGNPTTNYDPANDIEFLMKEIDLWFESIIKRNLEKIKDEKKAAEILAGLGIKEKHVNEGINKVGHNPIKLAKELRRLSKPMIIAANKIDLHSSQENFEKIKRRFPDLTMLPCSAEAEIVLKMASKSGLIEYLPGESDFKIKGNINPQQKKALELIRERILRRYGSTGVQKCLNTAVFDFLNYIAVYPVENENRFSDKKGNVLPDVHLMPAGSTALDLAYKIHTDIGKHFIGAIDARTKKRMAADHKLKQNDIISIQTSK